MTITWAQMETWGTYWRKDAIYFQRVQALLAFSPSLLAYASICTILKTTSRNKIDTIPSFRQDLCTQTSMWAACRRASSAQSAQTQDHRTDFLLLHLSSEFAVFRAPISLLLPYGSIWLVGAKGSQITRLPEAEALGPQGKPVQALWELLLPLPQSHRQWHTLSHLSAAKTFQIFPKFHVCEIPCATEPDV